MMNNERTWKKGRSSVSDALWDYILPGEDEQDCTYYVAQRGEDYLAYADDSSSSKTPHTVASWAVAAAFVEEAWRRERGELFLITTPAPMAFLPVPNQASLVVRYDEDRAQWFAVVSTFALGIIIYWRTVAGEWSTTMGYLLPAALAETADTLKHLT